MSTVTEQMIRPPYRRVSRSRNAASGGGAWSIWKFDGHDSGFLSSIWDRKVSTSTPGWKERRQSRALPINPHYLGQHRWFPTLIEQTQTFYASSSGAFSHETQWRMSANDYVVLGPEPADGLLQFPERNQAVARLGDEISLSNGSAAVTLGELNRTVGLVTDTMKRLARAYSALRKFKVDTFFGELQIAHSRKTRKTVVRARKTSPSEKADFAAKTWLEYSYGWKPLIKDVYDQLENLSNLLTLNEGIVYEGRASAKNIQRGVRRVLDADYAKVDKHFTWTTRTRFKVSYSITDNSYRNVFGMTNPGLVAWELLPFSFVVDWFLPVGQFIEGLTAFNGLTFHSGTETRIGSWSSHGIGETPKDHKIPSGPYYWTLTFDTSDFGTCTSLGKERFVLTSFPGMVFPEFSPYKGSMTRFASASALMHQVFGKGMSSARAFR